MKQRAKKKVNLALQGGGAHGALAWGALDFLLEDGRIEIDSICATSAGAVNGVILASGLIEGGTEGARQALAKFWHSICEYGEVLSPIKQTFWDEWFHLPVEYTPSYFLFNLITRLYSPYQFNPLNYNPLKDLLVSHVDFEKFKTSKHVKLFVCATNVKTGKVKVFDNQDITLESILASTCLPFLFQAVEIDGDSYWDGGYMGNPAIFPLIYNSPVNDILIVHINPIERNSVPTTSADILNRVNEISFNSSLMREMRAIAFVTKLIDQQWIKPEHLKDLKRIYMHSIRTDALMEHFSVASKFNTDWSFISKLFDIGRYAAESWFANSYDKIGVESSIDLNEFL